jgi:hypothetical protein
MLVAKLPDVPEDCRVFYLAPSCNGFLKPISLSLEDT